MTPHGGNGRLIGVDAADCYALLVKERIAPGLRQLGWRGSGQTYRLPNAAGHHVMLGLQRDRWNTRNRVSFTLNVSVITRAGWQQWPGTSENSGAPSANSYYGSAGWQQRIGLLLQPPGDYWWRVWGEQDVEPVAAEVLALVQAVVQPQVQARLDGVDPPPAPAWTWTAPHRDDETDLAALSETDEARAWGGHRLPRPVDLRSLQRAQEVVLTSAPTRTQARRLLRLHRWDVDATATALGAGDRLTFLELFCTAVVGRQMLDVSSGEPLRSLLGDWLEGAPHLPADTTLVMAPEAVQLLAYRAARGASHPSGAVALTPVVPVLCVLLDELNAFGDGMRSSP